MPFGRDTRVVPSNILLDSSLAPTKGEIWGSQPPVGSDVATTLCPLLYLFYSLIFCFCYETRLLQILLFLFADDHKENLFQKLLEMGHQLTPEQDWPLEYLMHDKEEYLTV